MDTKKSQLGKTGEDLAVRYLSKKKYKLIERNYRRPWGEIDIVVKAPDETLVFVEVKTMNEGELRPEDQMSFFKVKKFKKAALLYAGSHQYLINEKKGWRLDVITLTKIENCFLINHYENIV